MEKIVIHVPNGVSPKSAVRDVLDDMQRCADGRGRFLTATPSGVHYGVREDATPNENGAYIIDDYRVISVLGISSLDINGRRIVARLVSDVDRDDEDILEELVLRGLITSTEAQYTMIAKYFDYSDIEQWIADGVNVVEL